MNESEFAHRQMQLARQVAHWVLAAQRLQDLDNFASPAAWAGLERYLGMALRRTLHDSVLRLLHQAAVLRALLDAAQTPHDLAAVRRRLLAFRHQYLRTETMLDFFADAVNTRTNPEVAALLQACDSLAYRSMAQVLNPLDKLTPVVLTYVDTGLGASILKAGLRLWDGSADSPAAAIKVARHNLLRPTSLIHEAGHQVAHILGWNEELAGKLEQGLAGAPRPVAAVWASWASEIAADAFAFVHTGYASVAALHDVLAGGESFVLRFAPGDPHPVSYVRVMLGVEMCRLAYGSGPWDGLEQAWVSDHPLHQARPRVRALLEASLPLVRGVAAISLDAPMQAFAGRTLSQMVNPALVSPAALDRLERQIGPALYTSMHWLWIESLRLLALSGLRVAADPKQAGVILQQQQAWMGRLGSTLKAA